MGIFIICGALFVICILLAWLGEYCNLFTINIIGFAGAFIMGIILFISACFLPTLRSDFDYTKEKYYNLKAQVEFVESDMILNDANLRNQVLEMNNKIASHRVYSKNWWIGNFYSEEIGNLPRLQWKNELNLNN